MLYEVRVFDSHGKLKTTLDNKKLSNAFWDKFYNEDTHYLKKNMYSKINFSVLKSIRAQYETFNNYVVD